MCALFSGPKARSYRVADKQLECTHCENILFHDRKALLNTPGREFLNVAWLDRQAQVLICANCSRLEWFLDDDLVVAEED